MAARLEDLPPELISIIADFVTPGNHPSCKCLLNFRAVCRSIEAGSHRQWIRLYFRCRKLAINPEALAKLKEVASVPKLANAVTWIDICCYWDPKFIPPKPGMAKHSNETVKPGLLVTDALKNLKNLAIISFMSSEYHSGYGPRTQDVFDFPRTLRSVMTAVHKGGLRPEQVMALGCNFDIKASRAFARLPQALGSLTHLTLDIGPGIGLPSGPSGDMNLPALLSKTFSQMKSLMGLELWFDAPVPALIKEFLHTLHIPSLVSLDLTWLECEIKDLIGMLRNHAKTLTHFRLVNTLSREGDSDVEFRNLLATLASDMFHLEFLEVGTLFDEDGCPYDFTEFDMVEVRDKVSEDGWNKVDRIESLDFEGEQTIKENLVKMLNCMASTY